MEGLHKLQWTPYAALITLIISSLQPIIKATEKPGGTRGANTNDTSFSEESFLILSEGDFERRILNCTAPADSRYLREDLEVSLYWTPPSGVNLLKEPPDATPPGVSQGKARDGQTNSGSGAWVELAQNRRQLIFHNPDNSIRGPYTCQGRVGGRLVYRSTVWVHVFANTDESPYGTTQIVTALSVIAAFLAVVLLLLGVRAWCSRRRRRSQYVGAKNRNGHFEIPEIRIHTVEDQSNSYNELNSL